MTPDGRDIGSRSTHHHANSLNGQLAESEVMSPMSRVTHLSLYLLTTACDRFLTMPTARVWPVAYSWAIGATRSEHKRVFWTKMAHLPKIKREIFWDWHSTLPRPLPGPMGHPHGASSTSNLAPSALSPPTQNLKYATVFYAHDVETHKNFVNCHSVQTFPSVSWHLCSWVGALVSWHVGEMTKNRDIKVFTSSLQHHAFIPA